MDGQSYSITYVVDQSPAEVYAAVNDVRGWWDGQGIDGDTNRLGEFTYHYENLHRSRIRITELEPDKRVTWLVVEGGPTFVDDKTEWDGTTIRFEIEPEGDRTRLRFTHLGLAPELECYGACSSAWGSYVGASLKRLITTGVGDPSHPEPVS